MTTRYKPYLAYQESGVEWLGKVPEGWEVKPLKHFSTIDSCGCYGSEPNESGIVLPVATTAQIDTDGRFSVDRMPDRGFTPAEVQRYGCASGDILVVKSSGSATNIISGKSGIVDETTPKFIFSNFLMRVRPNIEIAVSKFVFLLLKSHLTRQRVELMCSTTTYPNLQVSEYSSSPLPIPPLSEQLAIAAHLDRETTRIDGLVEKKTRFIELLREKRQALITHAVTKGLDPHAKMKDSGVEWLGEVPEHWEVKRTRQVVARIESGTSVNSIDVPASDQEYGVLKTSCVSSEEFCLQENKAVVADEYDRVSCQLKIGALIVSRMNTPDLVGSAGLVRESRIGIFLPDRLWQMSIPC